MNNIRLVKLDNRYFGSAYFSHRAELQNIPYLKRGKLLNDIRIWCWDTYGPSCEVDYVHHCYGVAKDPAKTYPWAEPRITCKWAWRTDDKSMYIYLQEEALTHFQLKWM